MLRGVSLAGVDARTAVVGSGLVILAGGVLTSVQGGFFAPSWGWSAMLALGIAGLAAVLVADTDAGGLDAVLAGTIVALAAWTALSALWASDSAGAIEEAQRALVLVGIVGGLLLVASRRTVPVLVATLAAALVAV